jgi:hypothetical protein
VRDSKSKRDSEPSDHKRPRATEPAPPVKAAVVTNGAPDARSPEDLRLVVATLMELLSSERDRLSQYGAGLRDSYDEFAGALRRSGFRVNERRDRKIRAQEQRRLGELADALGNVSGAIAFYELALGSWPEIGCRRRMEQLRQLVHTRR